MLENSFSNRMYKFVYMAACIAGLIWFCHILSYLLFLIMKFKVFYVFISDILCKIDSLISISDSLTLSFLSWKTVILLKCKNIYESSYLLQVQKTQFHCTWIKISWSNKFSIIFFVSIQQAWRSSLHPLWISSDSWRQRLYPQSPFWSLSLLVLTPHRSYRTWRNRP